MPIPSKKEIRTALRNTSFLKECLPYVSHPLFDGGFNGLDGEMAYKRRLAISLQHAFNACKMNDKQWPGLLCKALRSKDNNILQWQARAPFCDWITGNPRTARRFLLPLFDSTTSSTQRMKAFCVALQNTGHKRLTQAGDQLTLVSLLLMGVEPDHAPPARSQVVSDLLNIYLDLDCCVRPLTAPERYDLCLLVLDEMIHLSRHTKHVLTSRLQAYGVVWCRYSPWIENAMKGPWRQTLGSPVSEDDDIRAAEKTMKALSKTEKEATILARRGQGRYRSALLERWSGCAVTGCGCEAVLRASHLKPWIQCTNRQRLDTDNGLLLTPTLDALLDRHLISFSGSGRIVISKTLRKSDLSAMGIDSNMRLRMLPEGVVPYLTQHQKVFARYESARHPRTKR